MRRCRDWLKATQTVRELNNLEDRELARIVFSQATGRAKAMLDVLEISDVTALAGLERICNLLDIVWEKLAPQRLDDGPQNWEAAHRPPGQPVADWCTHGSAAAMRHLRPEWFAEVVFLRPVVVKFSTTLVASMKRSASKAVSGTCLAGIMKGKLGLDAKPHFTGILETNEVSVVVFSLVKALEARARSVVVESSLEHEGLFARARSDWTAGVLGGR